MTKIKEHFTLKTTMYNIIMFRKTIFETLTRNTYTRASYVFALYR